MKNIIEVLKISFKDFFSEKNMIITYGTSIILYEVVYLVFLRVLYLNIPAIKGYSFYELVCIFGIFQIIYSIFHLFFAYFIWFQSKYIWDRHLDIVLTIPYSPLNYITLKEIPGQIMEIVSLTIGILIFVIGLTQIQGTGLKVVIIFPVLVLFGFLSFFGFSLFLLSSGILMYGKKSPFEIFYEIVELGQYPTDIFPKVLRILFTYVFPLFQIATLPYLSLKNKQLQHFSLLIISGLVWFFVGTTSFNRAIRKYKSGG